jgi:acetyltransferase-like isoleucine patch superfamily enzyme
MNPIEEIKLIIFSYFSKFPRNTFHPLVWVTGQPQIGDNVYIGANSILNAQGANLVIGSGCDIASFVTINCADSHLKTIGLAPQISRKDIFIGKSVFIGSHSVIKGGAHISENCVIAAGTIVDAGFIPPFSLVHGNPMQVKVGYYFNRINTDD